MKFIRKAPGLEPALVDSELPAFLADPHHVEFYPYRDRTICIAAASDPAEELQKNLTVCTPTRIIKPYLSNLCDALKEAMSNNADVEGYVVIDEKSFVKKYPLDSRTYCIDKGSKRFDTSALGNSLFGSSVDGQDVGVRLDWYLYGATDQKWIVEYTYILNWNQMVPNLITGDCVVVRKVNGEFEDLSINQVKSVMQNGLIKNALPF